MSSTVQQAPKRRPPRHLEKMLFINHKEDIMLQEKLDRLSHRSKVSIMEIERERIKVRNELRTSRKKNLVLSQAMRPADTSKTVKKDAPVARRVSIAPTVQERKSSMSAPPRRLSLSSQQSEHPSRRNSTIQPSQRRMSTFSQFGRQASIPEEDEDHPPEEALQRKPSKAANILTFHDQAEPGPIDSVGAYVLGEFRRISQVVPSILMALARKEEEEKQTRQPVVESEDPGNLSDYEPDLHRVTKLVSSVKKLKHRMSISKKLEACRPNKSLDQMIRENSEHIGEYDEFTDGTCVLMKRKLEKKRRDSTPVIYESTSGLQRRQSTFVSTNDLFYPTRASTAVAMDSRRQSLAQQLPPLLSRSATTLGFQASGRGGKFRRNSNSPIMDEDELYHRQRVARELEYYDSIKERVDKFLTLEKPQAPSMLANVKEQAVVQ